MDKRIKINFWFLISIFVIIAAYFFTPFMNEIKRDLFPIIAVLGIIFFISGGVLIYYTIKLKIEGKLKTFLIITGITPIAALISVILHNFVYGLMIYFFGEDFWKGGDEPFFFIIGLIVCPIAFIIGAIGSIVSSKKE